MYDRPAKSLRCLLYVLAAAVLLLFAPAPYVLAEKAGHGTDQSNTSCTPVTAAPSGIKKPTGSDASTYTYNSCTGLWENQYYTWSPATQAATPKTPLVYTCDTTTWQWMTKVWTYDPAAAKFMHVSVSQPTLPTGAIVAADSANPCAPAAPVPANSEPGGNPSTTNPVSPGNATTATMANTVGSNATTGNAAVTNNTTAGNAKSGNAKAAATVVNSVQSSSSLAGNGVVSFVKNIDGDVQGDLLIDPSLLQPASNSDALVHQGDITVNNQTTGSIHNKIDLAAQSGDATVADNTTAGNATTGSASAIANVVNLLNSVVSAGQSFIGVVNINGNLNGNILVPQSLIDSLVASNTPSTTVSLTPDQVSSLGITNNTNQSITNNVSATATSGNATVADNTTAGNTTTGSASTKVTVFNLTGSQIVGANCLLVFVNVSGKWVGMIMNAPGATAAEFGSGITTNTVKNAELANSVANSITNDINAKAKSGNASITDNTTAGNATSGDASSVVNLLNVSNSNLSLAGWFGILFINVLGNWYGNFGAFTPPSGQKANNAPPSSSNDPTSSDSPKVFRFTQGDPGITAAPSIDNTPAPTVLAQLTAETHPVLGTGIHTKPTGTQTVQAMHNRTQVIGGILVLGGIGMLATEQLLNRRARKAA